MIVHKKGYEHERYRIDKIQAFVGADRDVATIDYDLYSALLDEYKDMSAQCPRDAFFPWNTHAEMRNISHFWSRVCTEFRSRKSRPCE